MIRVIVNGWAINFTEEMMMDTLSSEYIGDIVKQTWRISEGTKKNEQ